MAKQPVARGQVSIYIQKDGYTISQSVSEYLFPADCTGRTLSNETIISKINVRLGDTEFRNFTILNIVTPVGFSAIQVNNVDKTITYRVAKDTTTLPEHGVVDIPILIQEITYHLSFNWSKVRQGQPGRAGTDSNLLDWVKDWNTGKTQIDGNTVITPKIFAGVKNNDGTLTGTALGHFSVKSKASDGSIVNETVDGLAGYNSGVRTFYLDKSGSSCLGSGEQFIRFSSSTGKIEFGSGVSVQWVGATFIDKNGLFSGRLSAETIKAISLNASQITAGTINTSLLDTGSLKTLLITAENIEALTLNVQRGVIGGWSIDTSSIYRGTKSDVSGSYTTSLDSITIGTQGLRGRYWRLDTSGEGALANGLISWDNTGKLTLSSEVTLMWEQPLSNLKTALGGESYPKLTNITATGIYTGSLSAEQINAGTLSADRILAGSIDATKLNAESVKANIVNAQYISGLGCSFNTGTIGGWLIDSGRLSSDYIEIDSSKSRIALYGPKTSTTYTGHRVVMEYRRDDDFGFYAYDRNGVVVLRLGSLNKIGGWTIYKDSIHKGSVYLGRDGSIMNSSRWQLKNDGSGYIASGNISWDTLGNVTLAPSISLQWQQDIDASKVTNYGYRYKHDIIINGDENTFYPVILKGGDQLLKREVRVMRAAGETGPDTWNTSTLKGSLNLLIKVNFGNREGTTYSWEIHELSEAYTNLFAGAEICGMNSMFAIFLRGGGTVGALYHLFSTQPIESSAFSPAPIPSAPQVAYNGEQIYSDGTTILTAPPVRTLTDGVREEIRSHQIVGIALSSDQTLQSHPLTHIDATGIYTGTLSAQQVNAVAIDATSIKTGFISSDRLSSGSITAEKLDVVSIRTNIVNAGYINGLDLNFERGRIGGFIIGTNFLKIENYDQQHHEGILLQLRSASNNAQGSTWFNGAYQPLGFSIAWNNQANGGHISFGEIALDNSTTKSKFLGLQMMSSKGEEYFCLSANVSDTIAGVVYNRIAGWAFDATHIWKNNISLGADGSITNGAKWVLNNDGSGQLASGNIKWDAQGEVTFSPNVLLQWQSDSKGSNELALALASGKSILRDSTFKLGYNSLDLYDPQGMGNDIYRQPNPSAPNDTGYVLIVMHMDANMLDCGGLAFNLPVPPNKTYIIHYKAKLPGGRNFEFVYDDKNGIKSSKWLTPTQGTDDWEEYVLQIKVGAQQLSQTACYIKLNDDEMWSDMYFEWEVAYFNLLDNTSCEGFMTTIDGNGIYSGSIHANQVKIDSELVVGGSLYKGLVTVKDANDKVLVRLDEQGITATKGLIGGWSLSSNVLLSTNSSNGHITGLTATGFLYNGDPQDQEDYWALMPDGSCLFSRGSISFAADGSGYVANRNLSWDTLGNITANNGVFNNVVINGTIRNAFILNDPTIYFGDVDPCMNLTKYDHVIAVRGTLGEEIPLPWTLEHSGRRVCLVNYKWRNNTTIGYMDITAPTGKYFYEDGIAKTTIRFSRELIELLGYGDDTTFFGWIVVNRKDIMTENKYGHVNKVLSQGYVVSDAQGVLSSRYKNFDGSFLHFYRLGLGHYRVAFPPQWTLGVNYIVNATGYSIGGPMHPIYASVVSRSAQDFQVITADDSTRNEGGFSFQVVSIADWN